MRYAWGFKGLGGDVDAQLVGEFIEGLEEKFNEHLTTEEILSAARNTRSPIYRLFTWNENDAAEKQRRREAKRLMKNLVMATKSGKPTRRPAFAFVRHSKHDRHVYINMRSALGRPDMREQVIQRRLRPLQHWITAHGGAREMRAVAPLVERLRKRIEMELMLATV